MLRGPGQRQPADDGLVVPDGGAPIAPVPGAAFAVAVPPGWIGPDGAVPAPGVVPAGEVAPIAVEPPVEGALPGAVEPGIGFAGTVDGPPLRSVWASWSGGAAPPMVAEPTSGPGQGGVAPGAVAVWAAANPAASIEAAANRRMELMACMSHLP